MVNNVSTRASLAAQANNERDGSVFRFARTRFQKRRILARVSLSLFFKSFINRFWNFRVNDQDCAQSRQLRHSFSQVSLRHVRKLINARMNQKAFETEHTSIR